MPLILGLIDYVATDGDLTERVAELRRAGRTPKEIARALGLKPSQVTPLIRAVGAAMPRQEAAVAGCWISDGWSAGLSVTGHADWPGLGADSEDSGSGLASVLVAREQGSSVSACGYLVDLWCLGVKDCLGPETMNRRKLPEFVSFYFQSSSRPPLRAPLELAQQVVLGAVEYARGLGFGPHPDYAACAGHLGEWDGRCDITFGHEGKPMFVQGPYDNPKRIMKTLRKSVGEGNFGFTQVFR